MSSLAEQEHCAHDQALADTHKCPDCGGIMRRCCQSTIGCGHDSRTCKVFAAARAKKAVKEDLEDG